MVAVGWVLMRAGPLGEYGWDQCCLSGARGTGGAGGAASAGSEWCSEVCGGTSGEGSTRGYRWCRAVPGVDPQW